jgi:hypothetical protein
LFTDNLTTLPNPLHPKMTNLDALLLKGASSKNPEENLKELRYAILTKGIPANSEGMVHYPSNAHGSHAPLTTPPSPNSASTSG